MIEIKDSEVEIKIDDLKKMNDILKEFFKNKEPEYIITIMSMMACYYAMRLSLYGHKALSLMNVRRFVDSKIDEVMVMETKERIALQETLDDIVNSMVNSGDDSKEAEKPINKRKMN